ncbi:hypothetical protein CMI37_27195 [Candidatus Pacearchaeota archaeon]|nr:hypothetical protein [Candidatus Pacearchaeota archaeon]
MELVSRYGGNGKLAGYDLVSEAGAKFGQMDIVDDTLYVYNKGGKLFILEEEYEALSNHTGFAIEAGQ